MHYPRVVVITLNFNGVSDTTACIVSVLKTTYPNFTHVVVDNGSKNDERKTLQQKFTNKRLQLLRNKKNKGFSEGNNQIIRKVDAQYVVLLNNDTVVEPEWLTELVAAAEKDKNIAACQAKIRSLTKPTYFEYAGAAGGFIDKLGYPYCRGRVGFFIEKDKGQYDVAMDIFWGSGTCLLLRVSALKNIELLPNDFFFYHEETDLCWRLNNKGQRIVFVPKAVVYHKGGSTSKREMTKRIFFVHRNNLLMIARNMPLIDLLWVLPIRLVTDSLSAIFYVANGDLLLLVSLFSAICSFYLRLPGILLRRIAKPEKKIMPQVKQYPLSIYWEYFFRGRKRYSQIVQ